MISPRTHELKVWPPFYEVLKRGEKTFEVRRDDRAYQRGDHLWLREWDPDQAAYSGRNLTRRVTFVLPGGQFGIEAGYVVLSLDDDALPDCAEGAA